MIIVDDTVELRKKLIEKFKNELPVLRARAKLSQESVAEKIGISRQTYSGIETGKREMSWTMFLALLAFFQNNELTKQYLSKMDGFEDEFIQVIGQTECGKQNSEITIEKQNNYRRSLVWLIKGHLEKGDLRMNTMS